MLSFQWAECGAWMLLAQAGWLMAQAVLVYVRDHGARPAVDVVQPARERARPSVTLVPIGT